MKMVRTSERGFTLVELLVAMAIAGILISLIFAVYTRMSVAYQAQNRITAVVQNLRAAQDKLVRELRMAGDQFPSANYRPLDFGPPSPPFSPDNAVPETARMTDPAVTFNGVKVAPTIGVPGQPVGHPLQPVYITNGGGTEPDQIRFFYADMGVGAKVDTITLGNITTITVTDHNLSDGVDPAALFVPGDFVLLVNSTQEDFSMDVDTATAGNETFEVTEYETCLLRVSTQGVIGQLTFNEASSPFNEFVETNVAPVPPSHCSDVLIQHDADIARPAAPRSDTMLYKLVARSYRIDPNRRDIGVFQFHQSGELIDVNTWSDLGIGFTNLQIASRWFNPVPVDQDLDGDFDYDWFSSDNQEFPGTTGSPPRDSSGVLVELALSLESRSFATVDAPTTVIDGYGSDGGTLHDRVGDSPPVTIPTTSDPRYNGEYVYRWSTVNFEFRNIGKGK